MQHESQAKGTANWPLWNMFPSKKKKKKKREVLEIPPVMTSGGLGYSLDSIFPL